MAGLIRGLAAVGAWVGVTQALLPTLEAIAAFLDGGDGSDNGNGESAPDTLSLLVQIALVAAASLGALILSRRAFT